LSRIFMKARNLVSIFAFTLPMCISAPYAVKAGGPAPNTGTIASLTGIVKFEGTAPKPKLIRMSAGPSCAKQHPSPVFAQEVVTDSKGDVQEVIVFVTQSNVA
jgi:hypothetical protein